MVPWLSRGLWRAVALLIALHGAMLLLRGDAAWRGFWFGLPAAGELALAWALVSRRPAARFAIAAMALVALRDAVRVWPLTPVVPMSLGLAVALAVRAWRPPRPRPLWSEAPAILLGFAVVPLLWIGAFGSTDYRRRADAIVVLGASAQPMAERTRTALELRDAGLADTIVFSCGPGEAPRDVPAVIDEAGVSTRDSARNVAALARERGWRRVLVVSHGYHLPRAKMAFLQEGLDVRTVPCDGDARKRMLLREGAAFYAYLLGVR